MPEEIMCSCGAVLVEEVTDAGVRPLGGVDVVPFRRTTDYVMCESCLLTYNVRDLIERTRDADVITRLERLVADDAEEPPPGA